MGFGAYILETLRQHGSAELGSMGHFSLDYTPAKWMVHNQSFAAPKSKLVWTSNPGSTGQDFVKISQTIAYLHDISFQSAHEFVNKVVSDFNNSNQVDLGSLGILSKQTDDQIFSSFQMNPALESSLKVSNLNLKPLAVDGEADRSINWWLALASAIFLATLFWVIGLLAKLPNQSNTAELQFTQDYSSSNIKETNMAPQFSTEDLLVDSNQNIEPSDFIIITGTFCENKNLIRAKSLLTQKGYHLYEEKLENNCTRIGILFSSLQNRDQELATVRNTLEPGAWILDQ